MPDSGTASTDPEVWVTLERKELIEMAAETIVERLRQTDGADDDDCVPSYDSTSAHYP